MTQNPQSPPPKADPESLVLRGSPRRVTRFKRGLLVGVSAVAIITLLGVVGWSLKSPAKRSGEVGQDLYNVERKATPESLATLPATYADIKKPEPAVPQLGPPLPGDLGHMVLAKEKELGITPDATGSSFEQDAEVNDARAERIRLAQQARRAKEGSVFFPLSPASSAANRRSEEVTQGGGGSSVGDNVAQLNLNPDTDQNSQQRKLDFVSKSNSTSVYNAYPLQDAVSPYQVMAGSIIAASLVTGINSDLPGLVVAQVTENIFDTVSGRFLLIPQGSKLIGSYDSVVAFGQSRALLVWQRIVMPNGSSIQIENLPATDASGYAGLSDQVDFHTWRLLKGVVLSTLLGIGTELSLGNDESDLVRAIRQSTQQNVSRAGERITEKNLNIQPTITIRQGWPLRVIVHKDLILRPYKG